jgi:hypothetical protein
MSVRSPKENLAAARGGVNTIHIEYPASALVMPHPLNLQMARSRLNGNKYRTVLVSTNIGKRYHGRASACHSALILAITDVNTIVWSGGIIT